MYKQWLLVGALIASPLFGADESAQQELRALHDDVPAWKYVKTLMNHCVWTIENDRWNPTLDVKTLQNVSSKNLATDIVFAGISTAGSFISNYGLQRAFPRFFNAHPAASCLCTLSAYLATHVLINRWFIKNRIINPLASLNVYNYAKRYRITRLLPCVQSAMTAELIDEQRFVGFIIAREQLSSEQLDRIKRMLQYLIENPDYTIAEFPTRPTISMSLAATKALEVLQRPSIAHTPEVEQMIQRMREARIIATSLSRQEALALRASYVYGDHAAHRIAAIKFCNHVGTLNSAPLVGLVGGNYFASAAFGRCSPYLQIGLRTTSHIVGAASSILIALASRIRFPFYSLIAHTPFKAMIDRKLKISKDQPTAKPTAREALRNLDSEERQRFARLMTFIMETGCCPPLRFDTTYYYLRQNAARRISLLFNQMHPHEPIEIR